MAGQRARQMRNPTNNAMLASERPPAASESVGSFDHRKGIFSMSGPGSAPVKDKPRSGLISPEKIVTAMPGGESDCNRIWNELDVSAEPQIADRHQHDA